MNELATFFDKLKTSFNNDTFVKVTLSKPAHKNEGLKNLYIRLVLIKDEPTFSVTYHYQTNDQVKNFNIDEVEAELTELLGQKFKVGILFTLEEDYTIQFSKKGKMSSRITVPSFEHKPPITHDQPKKKRAILGKYLMLLALPMEREMLFLKWRISLGRLISI